MSLSAVRLCRLRLVRSRMSNRDRIAHGELRRTRRHRYGRLFDPESNRRQVGPELGRGSQNSRKKWVETEVGWVRRSHELLDRYSLTASRTHRSFLDSFEVGLLSSPSTDWTLYWVGSRHWTQLLHFAKPKGVATAPTGDPGRRTSTATVHDTVQPEATRSRRLDVWMPGSGPRASWLPQRCSSTSAGWHESQTDSRFWPLGLRRRVDGRTTDQRSASIRTTICSTWTNTPATATYSPTDCIAGRPRLSRISHIS